MQPSPTPLPILNHSVIPAIMAIKVMALPGAKSAILRRRLQSRSTI